MQHAVTTTSSNQDLAKSAPLTLPRSVQQAIKSAEIDWQSKTIRLFQKADPQAVRASLREFDMRLAPATTNEIQVLLGELSVSMMVENAAAEDAGALAIRYKKYIESWSKFPIDILKTAITEWFEKNRFFPAASDINEIAEVRLARREAARRRLQAVLEFDQTEAFESDGTQEDRRKDIEASLGRVGKPLLIPTTPADIQALLEGTRNKIFLLNGDRWNATTCFVGRPVFLSKGYGKRGVNGVISSFEALPVGALDPDSRKLVTDLFGELRPSVKIAVIEISHLKQA